MIKRKTAERRVPKMRTGLRGKKGRGKPKAVDERVSEKKPIDSVDATYLRGILSERQAAVTAHTAEAN